MPLSATRVLVDWNRARMMASANTFSVPSGMERRTRNRAMSSRAAAPPERAPKPRRETTCHTHIIGLAWAGLRAASRATMATTAPTASISTPSASSTVATERLTFSRFSSGWITVGPVTMTRVPNRMALRHGQAMIRWVAAAAPAAVTRPPNTINRRIESCACLSRLIFRFMPPSKRMTATANPVRMCSAGPRASGRITPRPSGPKNTPTASSRTMPGTRR